MSSSSPWRNSRNMAGVRCWARRGVRSVVAVLIGSLATVGAANANTTSGANPPASAPNITPSANKVTSNTPANASQNLLPGSRLQGEASLRFWGLRIYHARLWTMPSFQADNATQHALALELEYQRDLQGAAIAERSLQEMQRVAGITAEAAQRWLQAMQQLFPNVKAGERITGVYQPGVGASFWHDSRRLGQIDDPEFARRFFGIWLAPSTSEPKMRLALLGLSDSTGR